MTPFYRDSLSSIYLGDCGKILGRKPSVFDLVLTDPPYGLRFMGKKWDYDIPRKDVWGSILATLKPGGHLFCFGGSRTYHRLACEIEDAGFEIRDCIMWVYGTGFPKSLDVAKGIDKAEGVWRGRAGAVTSGNDSMSGGNYERTEKGEPVTEEGIKWNGWGTALKPAYEPILIARKPLQGTLVKNVLTHGAGGLNIDACRIPCMDKTGFPVGAVSRESIGKGYGGAPRPEDRKPNGRFPANLIHDGSEEVVGLFPRSKSAGGRASLGAFRSGGIYGKGIEKVESRDPGFGDDGSAARFFYCAKASGSERDMGLGGMDITPPGELLGQKEGSAGLKSPRAGAGRVRSGGARNTHPTVKPLALMEYLVKLGAHKDSVVLDPFMGSGTTLLACKKLGIRSVGIEISKDYCEIAKRRVENYGG